MYYLGGKWSIRNWVAEAILSQHTDQVGYIEPFVGGCNIPPALTALSLPKVCLDIDPDIEILFKAVQSGWLPPQEISREEYYSLKVSPPSPLRSFVAFCCSFGGKKWGGYAAPNPKNPNYAYGSYKWFLRIAPSIQGVIFKTIDYRVLKPERALIYCDPPYANTTAYARGFNSIEFWDIMRRWAINNTVLISCYEYPPDFNSIARREKRLNVDKIVNTDRSYRLEHIVMCNPS